MSSTLPTTTSEVTAEWLTSALQTSGTLPSSATVAEVTIDPAAAGIGFMGEVGMVGVTYEGDAAGAPSSVVVKFPTASPEVMAMMLPLVHTGRSHHRHHLRPALS